MATKKWIDETGLEIPTNRITRSEKLKEQKLETLLRKAKRMNEQLTALKVEMADAADEIYEAVMAENGVNKTEWKGNFRVKNFNGSVMLEVDVNERIEFDDALIAVAKNHFDEFLTTGTGGVDEMIRQLIADAFNNSKGRLDAKKITNLLKYRSRIDAAKYPSFHAAIDAIEKSISRPSSKRYFRISQKDEFQKMTAVDLNFSSI